MSSRLLVFDMRYELTKAGERAVWPYLARIDRIRHLFTPTGGGSRMLNGKMIRADVWHDKPEDGR